MLSHSLFLAVEDSGRLSLKQLLTAEQIVELLSRGWTDDEIRNVMGENLMRVMDAVVAVKEELKGELPSSAVYEKRTDLPAKWGGPGDAYLPLEVREVVKKLHMKHDEL